MIALVLVLMLGTPDPPVRAGDPVPGVPNTATAAAKPGEPVPCLPGPCPGAELKTKHDTAKPAIRDVRAVSDPIPGVDTPSPGPHGDDKPKPKFP